MTKQKIEITLPADLEFSATVRRLSEEVFTHIGFNKDWTNRLKLVVDELFMNANRYGSKNLEGKIYVLFSFDENEVSFRIEDEGGGAQKMTAEELKKLIHKNSDEINDVTKTSGRGLALISHLWTDDLTIEDGEHGGIAITFTKKITTEAPPAPPTLAQSPSLKPESAASEPKGLREEIKISGEVDASNLEDKVQAISEKVKNLPEGSTLILDCAELVYVNSTFIGHMAAWLNNLQAKNGHLSLKNTNKQIRDVLELVGLSKVIYVES